MKGIRSRLLPVALFLCLVIAVPVRAGEDAVQMSRSERLLLLSNVASLWKLHVRIGTVPPDDLKRHETFGLVKNGQLSPSFVARAALQIMLRDADAPRSVGPEWKTPRRPADVPQRYDICIPFKHLEIVAQEWLGCSFDRSALPRVDYIMQKEDCLYADAQRLMNSWPCPMYPSCEHDIFAQPFKISSEQDTWIMKGEVWDIQQRQDGTLDVTVCDTFRLAVKKTGRHWRVLSLDFAV